MFFRCPETVNALNCRVEAISFVLLPSPINTNTAISRGESMAGCRQEQCTITFGRYASAFIFCSRF
jgi:hypothetical protein